MGEDITYLEPLTVLIGCLNVLIEYFNRLKKFFIGRAQPTFGWAWALLGYAPV